MSTAAALMACRVFLHAAVAPGSAPIGVGMTALEASPPDWDWLATYLCGSGLARPLLGISNDPDLRRIAPAAFLTTLSERGVFDLMREQSQRAVIARIDAVLTDIGATGVLLKGSAFVMRTTPPAASRATSDIDLWVEAEDAVRLRHALLAVGFVGSADAGASTFHHLEPISAQGIAVEIHTRLMAAFWGLPEADMLAARQPLGGARSLATLSPEGMAVHAAVHASASFLSFGGKTGWDLWTLLQNEPGLDWTRLRQLVSTLRVPRAFWAPFNALTSGLALPVPTSFAELAPHDRGAERAERLARERLFSAVDGLFDLTIVQKTRLVLPLFDSWSNRAAYLAAKLRWRGGRPGTWRAAVERAQHATARSQIRQ